MSFNQTTHIFEGVAYPYEYRTPVELPIGATLVDLYTTAGPLTALTWLMPQQFMDYAGFLVAGTLFTHEIPQDFMGASLILTRFDRNLEANILNYLSDKDCPIKGELDAIRQVVNSLQNEHLKRFTLLALSNPTVYTLFWTSKVYGNMPCDCGSLPAFSRLMADHVSKMTFAHPADKEYAMVYALLHGIGKIWCNRENEFEQLPQHLDPETVGYDVLYKALVRLNDASPDDAEALDWLFSGRWRKGGPRFLAEIGALVDGLSEEIAKPFITPSHRGHPNWRPILVE